MLLYYIFLMVNLPIYAMQHQKVHKHHHHHNSPEIVSPTIEELAIEAKRQQEEYQMQRRLSDERDEARFVRRRKLAIIGFATTSLSVAAGLIVYFFK